MLNLWCATTGRIQDGQIASVIGKVAHAVLALSGREVGSDGMKIRGRVREEVGRQRGEERAASGRIGTVRSRRDLRVRLRLRLRVFDYFRGPRSGADAMTCQLFALCLSFCLSVLLTSKK